MRTSRSLFLLPVLALALLAGCGGTDANERVLENAIEKQTGGDADVDMGADGAVRVETKDGTFTTGQNELPVTWPEDAPVYPGAAITYSASMNPQTGEAGDALVLTTTDAVKAVADSYRGMLVQNGWTISATMQSGGSTIMGATKDTRSLSLVIAGTGEGTTITIGVSEKQE